MEFLYIVFLISYIHTYNKYFRRFSTYHMLRCGLRLQFELIYSIQIIWQYTTSQTPRVGRQTSSEKTRFMATMENLPNELISKYVSVFRICTYKCYVKKLNYGPGKEVNKGRARQVQLVYQRTKDVYLHLRKTKSGTTVSNQTGKTLRYRVYTLHEVRRNKRDQKD